MNNQEFLKKLITRRKKQIAVLSKYNSLSHMIKEFEDDIILAQIKMIENKMKK